MDNLYFKNGKVKKKYCMCLSEEYARELRRCNGHWCPPQCAGLRCPYYSRSAGRSCGAENLKKHAERIAKERAKRQERLERKKAKNEV